MRNRVRDYVEWQSVLRELDKLILWLNKINWASIAILTALWTILFSFQLSDWDDSQQQYERKRTYLTSLDKELSSMAVWAKEKYHDGSLQSYQMQNQHFNWYNPSHKFLSFNYPIIQNTPLNQTAFQLNPALIDHLLSLNQKIASIFEKNAYLEQFKFSFPDLYWMATNWIVEKSKQYKNLYNQLDTEFYENHVKNLSNASLKNYLDHIYAYNYGIFVCGIGNDKEHLMSNCGVEKIGLHAMWKDTTLLVHQEIDRLKAPCWVQHFWLSELAFFFFFVPTLYSAVKRRAIKLRKRKKKA